MRSLLLFISYILFSTTLSIAQSKWEVQGQFFNPMKDNINIGWFNIDNESWDNHTLKNSSFGAGFVIQHNYNIQNSFRLRLGISRTNILEFNNPMDYNHGKQNIFHITPGWVHNIPIKKLTFYVGFETPFNIHGNFVSKSQEYTPLKTTTVDGGISFGLGSISGFQLHLGKLFYIGSEIAPSILYYSVGNKTKFEYDGGGFETKDRDYGFTKFLLRYSINLGIKIGKRKDIICPTDK